MVVGEAPRVERLAYTRTQAAESLGVSRSTFNRRVLPLIETVAMPWDTRLIPVDELQRLLAERRQTARAEALPRARPGRPPLSRPTSSTESGPNTRPAAVSATSSLPCRKYRMIFTNDEEPVGRQSRLPQACSLPPAWPWSKATAPKSTGACCSPI